MAIKRWELRISEAASHASSYPDHTAYEKVVREAMSEEITELRNKYSQAMSALVDARFVRLALLSDLKQLVEEREQAKLQIHTLTAERDDLRCRLNELR